MVIEGMLADDYGELTVEQFGAVMDAVEATPPEVHVRIRVRIEDGNIIAYGPDGRPLPNNRLRLGSAEVAIEGL